MDFWRNNLNALAASQPELARLLENLGQSPGILVRPSRRGEPALKAGKAWLCSTVDPVTEGQRTAAQAPSGSLACFGFGMGYHLDPLADREMLVLEPDARVLSAALAARDLSGLFKNCRVYLRLEDLPDLDGMSLFLHRPSQRLHPSQAKGLERLLNRKSAPGSRPHTPRVLVAPPIFGGTLPAAHWCSQALADLGCQVSTPPLEAVAPLYDLVRQSPFSQERLDRVRAPMVDFLGEALILEAEKVKPHLMLALAQAPLASKVLEKLAQMGVITAFWFVEDFRQMGYFREVAAAYDYFFHIQGDEMEAELDRLGANHSYLPVAAHLSFHRPIALSTKDRLRYGAPVGFLGAGYPNRQRVFNNLIGAGLDIRIWGNNWPESGPLSARVAESRYLDSGEVVNIYNACDIVLNLHSSIRSETRIGGVDFVNPRTFEVPACGGFQLVDHSPVLAKMLKPGVEVADFVSESDLVDKMNHYLKHPGERQAIQAAARRRVLNEHTYHHRMDQLLTRCLGSVGRKAAPKPAEAEGRKARIAAMMLENLA